MDNVTVILYCQSDYGLDDDYFELSNGDFVKVDEFLESLLDECDRKEVSNVN